MSSSATYLYAITRSDSAGDPDGLRGVADTPVRALRDGELALLVSTVDLAEFGEDALRTNLENLDWLERTARQHDEVVRRSAAGTTTLPMRLATICSDDESARGRLRRLAGTASATLARLDGRQEWGVKLYAAPSPTPSVASEHGDAAAMSGTAYLQRRREQLARRESAVGSAMREADDIYRRLAERSVDACRHRPQDPRLSGAAQPMLLNAAFLVDAGLVADFRDAVADLADARPAESLVLTGPWPPYSFATVDES